jgi:hypothetical protein
MNGLSQELAVTRITDANNAFCGDGRSNNNIFIWVIIFVIFFFFIGGDGFGFGGSNNQCCCKRCRRHHHRCRDENDNGLDGIFGGGNGWFILIIFAVLFLFNDGGANTNIINVDTDDAQV